MLGQAHLGLVLGLMNEGLENDERFYRLPVACHALVVFCVLRDRGFQSSLIIVRRGAKFSRHRHSRPIPIPTPSSSHRIHIVSHSRSHYYIPFPFPFPFPFPSPSHLIQPNAFTITINIHSKPRPILNSRFPLHLRRVPLHPCIIHRQWIWIDH
ncbi:hypothetical protein BDR03DRAFT_373815 [Suillus americanus]|nr:hypothetical protein BDR03DRAFT_373815 [Suillus americanus]